MTPASDPITQAIQHALSLVTSLVEGGVDPFASQRGEATVQALCMAQEALEEAVRHWGQRPGRTAGRPRTKGVRP